MNHRFVRRRKTLKLGTLALCALTMMSVVLPVRARSSAPVERLSGLFASTGGTVARKLLWAGERVNARDGIALAGGARMLQLGRYDSKGQNEKALSAPGAAMNSGARIVMQGNSQATAAALHDAIDKNNERRTFWHFRFDVQTNIRVAALMDVVKDDHDVKRTVITANRGNDLTLLTKAAREVGHDGKFSTFYGNALGAPAGIGDARLGRVLAVADRLPNVQTLESAAFYRAFRQRFPNAANDYVPMRMQVMIEALARAFSNCKMQRPGR